MHNFHDRKLHSSQKMSNCSLRTRRGDFQSDFLEKKDNFIKEIKTKIT